jgi:hypothetical protein
LTTVPFLMSVRMASLWYRSDRSCQAWRVWEDRW